MVLKLTENPAQESVFGHVSSIGWSMVDKFFALLAPNREVASC
jgi:hypothetical protein